MPFGDEPGNAPQSGPMYGGPPVIPVYASTDHGGQLWTAPPVNGGWPAPIPAAPLPAPHRRRLPLVLALIAALVVAGGSITGGALWWRATHRPLVLTVDGVNIDHPARVLLEGQAAVDEALQGRTAVRNADTRCYFMRSSATVAAHHVATDVDPELVCGPVLFTDSDAGAPFLFLDLASRPNGNTVLLTPSGTLSDTTTHPPPAGAALLRPDGKSLPRNVLTLTPPAAPPAAPDTFVAADLTKAKPGTSVVNLPTRVAGYEGGLVVESVNEVERFGAGENTRSEPSGYRLLAFKVQATESAYSSRTGGSKPDWGVSISGSALLSPPKDLLLFNDTQFVVAVASNARSANLVLRSRGVSQSVSLLTGAPASGNITVLTRTHLSATDSKVGDVPLVYNGYGQVAHATARVRADGAYLGYWGYGPTAVKHPPSPDRAFLEVPIVYTDSSAPNPTEDYAFPASMLTLTPTGGSPVKAVDLAPGIAALDGKVFTVFEVPADFTTGTVTVSGSVQFDDKTVLSVGTPFTVAVDIPAG